MSDRLTRLIVNADDFGLSPGVSAGILYAHKYGILTSTTAMVNTDFSKQSIKEAKSFPNLGIGLHLVLDAGRPISSSVNSLTDDKGSFLKGQALIGSAKKTDVKRELEAQLSLLYKWGVEVTHIDSHHHMHIHIPCAMEAVQEIASRYKLPVRSFSETELPGDVLTTDHFCKNFYGEENVSPDFLLEMFSSLEPGVTEMMCHPAFIDSWLSRNSSYTVTRMKELETLVDSKMMKWVKEHSIELSHYGTLED